jgi:hypothetical protein
MVRAHEVKSWWKWKDAVTHDGICLQAVLSHGAENAFKQS